ncbi:unnamed protein product [Heterobilharzia americana]|nr:unnamed protein product [Heterobilharzia americana]
MTQIEHRRRIELCLLVLISILLLSLSIHVTGSTSKKLFGHAKLEGGYETKDQIGPLPIFLYSRTLQADDLIDVLEELKNYVARYDHQIVCGDMKPKDDVCRMAMNQLALKYFHAALNATTQMRLKSYVWRQTYSDRLYGVMLILDPKQDDEQDEMRQILRASTYQRDACASMLLESGNNERLRYIRLHIGPDRSATGFMRQVMLRQFVQESTQLYLCSEYKAAGVHTVAIFANQLSVEHFINSGFQVVECGSKLYDICGNSWFKNRCLMERKIKAEDCR